MKESFHRYSYDNGHKHHQKVLHDKITYGQFYFMTGEITDIDSRKSNMTGMVNKVIMLLRAVRDTESATSPLASIEKTLEELPPGEQAIIIIPIKTQARPQISNR